MDIRTLCTWILGLSAIQAVHGEEISCYLCLDTTEACINDATKLPESSLVTCNTTNRECYVFAQYLAGTTTVNSFARSCTIKGTYSNRCVADAHFNSCYSVCSANLCNSQTDLHSKYSPDVSDASSMLRQSGTSWVLVVWACIGAFYIYPRLL